jgi:pimeloyl-ACP methyl ester carboxylesterase
LQDLTRPDALTAALNWYRGSFSPLSPGEASLSPLPAWTPIRMPVLGVWGEKDPFLLEPQMALSAGTVAGPWWYERISEAGHWLMLDQPELLNRLLIDFLREPNLQKQS